jgi:agmatine/peptidylarginine deiminase
MACKSSVISQKKGSVRNKDITQQEAEDYFKKYYGVSKVIWLEGVTGLDITDMHIDGFMKFINSSTMLTMEKDDFWIWDYLKRYKYPLCCQQYKGRAVQKSLCACYQK